VNEDGAESEMTLPLTIADWAATEGRFKKHFKAIKGEPTEEQVPFHEYLRLTPDEREGKTAFIHIAGPDRRLSRLSVSPEIAQLAAERQQFWLELRHLAGLEVPESVRDRVAQQSESEFEARAAEIRREYEEKLAQLRATYPLQVARKLAEGLLRSPGGQRLAHELLTNGQLPAALATLPVVEPAPSLTIERPAPAPVAAAPATVPQSVPPAATPAAAATGVATTAADEDSLDIEAYIESLRCTTCNECTNLNSRMFTYNANKQAIIKDRKAGTFAQLVQAAEKCPVSAIHPGTPLNPKEKDLAKWIERAKPFN
jgi:pyruvate-ferredoxin/flavodoxin oxidoreductase